MENRIIKKNNIIISFLLMCAVFFSCFTNVTYAADATGNSDNPYTVAQAIKNQNNHLKNVTGYVVGQPTSSTKVLTKGFTGDTAIAIADSSSETSVSKMLFVQITSLYRNDFGLKTNPDLIGKQVKVSGYLTSYFSHYGLKSITGIEEVTESGEGEDDDTDETDGDNGGTSESTGESTSGDSGISSTETTTEYDSTYYADAMNKSGEVLKASLHDIIDGHKKLSYSAVWNALKDTDEDPNNTNNVLLLYTGRSQAKSSNGSGVNDWNREHVWAKSHGDFGTAAGPGTDLHHLRATDVSVNSCRGNLDFDNGGTPHSEATLCKYDSDSWEPRDAVKGDVARMLFYMAVRYEGDNGEVDLELNNKVNNGKDPYMGKLSVLLEWNKQDPVDDIERRRNDIIYTKYQYNRNPFIDHPEWADSIWG